MRWIQQWRAASEYPDINGWEILFSSSDLKRLIIPLTLEQLLTMMVGVVNIMMVSYNGEEVVSGVSLVDMINNLFLFIFSALATRGAVVVSQYLGSGDPERGNSVAGQLVMVVMIQSVGCMALALAFNQPILEVLFWPGGSGRYDRKRHLPLDFGAFLPVSRAV